MKKTFKILRSGFFVALACAPILLSSAGCGGGSDGSRPSNLKTNAPLVSGNLTFSEVSENNLLNATPLIGIASISPATLTNTRANAATSQKLVLSATTENTVISTLTLSLDSSVTGESLAPFSAGQRLEFPRAGSNIEFTQTSEVTRIVNRWRVAGGAVVVRSLSASGAELFFDNVRFEPSDSNSALGSFALNGTLSATDLNVRG